MTEIVENGAREDTLKQFSAYLRKQMAARDMIAADLARLTGFASSVISTWTQGKRLPSPESLEVVSRELAIPIDELLVQAGHRPRLRVDDDPDVGEMEHLFRQLPPKERKMALDFVRWRWETARLAPRAGRQASHLRRKRTARPPSGDDLSVE